MDRKGLCGFFPMGFALEEKLCGAKCCKFYGPGTSRNWRFQDINAMLEDRTMLKKTF